MRRFDRHGRKGKHSLEDFAQLAGRSRGTKYDYSMERVAEIIERYCTFPVVEKVKLFRLTLFNFLVGNVLTDLERALPACRELIHRSFLSDGMRQKYAELFMERARVLR